MIAQDMLAVRFSGFYPQRTSGRRFRLEPFAKIWSVRVRGAWQAHRKHRALARFARHGHVAAHHARELARERKAEPGAAVAARGERVGLSEFLEQFRLLFGGQADAG